MKITSSEWVSKFKSIKVDSDEFKKVIKEFVGEIYPNEEVERFDIKDDGLVITLGSGEEVEIEIDWNEFVLK